MTFPDFARFFEICRDVRPYPWQLQLANQVLANGRWPDVLDLPTGSGKTSAVDIALYALVAAAHNGEFSVHPRRIIVVVDRRVLVDQAWRHGQQLLDRVNKSAELAPVRSALAKLSPKMPCSIRLRGACPTDRRWCRSADQVQIVASTVDQIGSRLLFRGYGVTPRMRSVEAGLVGQDTLLLLDEAHLAGPFLDTLGHLRRLDPVRGITPRRHVVQLSATTAAAAANERFTLSPTDTKDSTLRQRLTAPKMLLWSEKQPEGLVATIEVPCLLLVANTVRTALDWFVRMAKTRSPSKPDILDREPFLITGRMRPVDREEILNIVKNRLDRRDPTLVIATQCIEVGVDWDFDAMVSECASWDALVQRMGRVNRRGERDEAHCFVLSAKRTLRNPKNGKKVCPIYGRYETETAKWLARVSPVRCPPGAMPKAPKDCVRSPTAAPLLIPEYLDLWSQNRATGPMYDISVFLHGTEEDQSAQVVWRDLGALNFNDRTYLEEMLQALPPTSLEALPLPLGVLRKWLGERRVIRLGTQLTISTAKDIGPGFTLVVPTEYGGIGRHGTFDGSHGRVVDKSMAALREHRRLEFEFHDAPALNDAEPVADQVQSWIKESEARQVLANWERIDLGQRWLFVSALPDSLDDDGHTFQPQRVNLESHLNGVLARTRDVARRIGLSCESTDDLVLAAKLHDLGKLDARFQRLCARKQDSLPLAQSGHSWIERRDRAALSDYPTGERHEALSVELMIQYGLHTSANDRELVEHLVASHHGWARPFIRAAEGVAQVDDRVFGVDFTAELEHDEAVRAPARFRSVQKRFGWHGLAWLEAILQLSDHCQVKDQNKGNVVSVGGEPFDICRQETRPPVPFKETTLATLNGLVPSDYLAALGVLRALNLANERALLRWQGTQPCFATALAIRDIVECITEVRQSFRHSWPFELNKITEDQCNELLLTSEEPFRSLVVAILSSGGRSDMDFISGVRGGFKSVFEWATTNKGRRFSPNQLHRTLVGPRSLASGGKSFRWSPLAAQGARRPKIASDDRRTEPWIEWLSVMGISSLVSVPNVRSSRLCTRSTAVYGHRWDDKQFRWPLWHNPLAWQDVFWAVAGTRASLRDALWCEAERLPFGTRKNRTFGFAAGRPHWT